MNSVEHAGLAGYMLRARLGPAAPRPDGAVASVFDGTLRVRLHPAGRGDLVLEAQLCALPSSTARADDMLEDALIMAAHREPEDADCLVLAPEQDCLLLLQRIGADASADQFEGALGRFLDSLTSWRVHFGVL